MLYVTGSDSMCETHYDLKVFTLLFSPIKEKISEKIEAIYAFEKVEM